MRVVAVPVAALLTVGKRLQLRVFSARFVAQVAVKEKMPDRKPFSRLPKDVIPKNYAIRLKPDLSKLTFEGQQAITVQVLQRCFAVVGGCRHVCTRALAIPLNVTKRQFSYIHNLKNYFITC